MTNVRIKKLRIIVKNAEILFVFNVKTKCSEREFLNSLRNSTFRTIHAKQFTINSRPGPGGFQCAQTEFNFCIVLFHINK